MENIHLVKKKLERYDNNHSEFIALRNSYYERKRKLVDETKETIQTCQNLLKNIEEKLQEKPAETSLEQQKEQEQQSFIATIPKHLRHKPKPLSERLKEAKDTLTQEQFDNLVAEFHKTSNPQRADTPPDMEQLTQLPNWCTTGSGQLFSP